MGFFSAIGSLFSGAVGITTSLARSLAPLFTEIAGHLLTRLANAFEAFFRELGLVSPDEKTEELGDKALQAEMDEDNPIRPEDFDLYSEYVETVRKYEADPEMSARISLDDKERKGMELESGLALEKYGQPMLDVLDFVGQHPERFSDGLWLGEFGKAIRENSAVLPAVANYIARKDQPMAESDMAFATLEKMERLLAPEASANAVWEAVKQRVASDKQG